MKRARITLSMLALSAAFVGAYPIFIIQFGGK